MYIHAAAVNACLNGELFGLAFEVYKLQFNIAKVVDVVHTDLYFSEVRFAKCQILQNYI